MKWLHNLLKGISLTGALFVFQACYGSPQNPMWNPDEAEMSFSVVSHVTGAPLEGVKVSQTDHGGNRELGTTDAEGKCRVRFNYQRNYRGPYLRFEAPDEVYAVKDTVLDDLRYREITVKMDPRP
ncbi:MAG: hypothetical protein J6W09_06890 [Bacteroidales bacterium]|nr:hypothetical protein [Bacteroidales bacterium]